MCGVRVPPTPGCGACPAATAFPWTLPCRSSLARIRICDRQPGHYAPADHLAPPLYESISCHRPQNPPETSCIAPCGPWDVRNTATSGAGVGAACGPVPGRPQGIEAGWLGRFA